MNFTTLGDPHLGRSFRTGVPLHRVGDREAMVWKQFDRELQTAPMGLHINMGDLFDKFVVAPEIVLKAAGHYRRAAEAKPETEFLIVMGNHDVSRDAEKASCFDIFRFLVAPLANIHVLTQPSMIGNYGFVPFNAFRSAEDLVAELPDGLERVFMHHDYLDYGGPHVIPTRLLASKGIFNVTNGHDHIARVEKRHGVTVTMTGSMQPYSHAEDPEGDWYRTVTLDQLQDLDATDLNIRVMLAEGESLPTDLDCLSLIAKRISVDEAEGDPVDTTEFETFDIASELEKLLPVSIREEVMGVFNAA